MSDQFDREVDQLERDLADGLIDLREFNAQMRDLQRDYRAEAEQSAQDAYRRGLANW